MTKLEQEVKESIEGTFFKHKFIGEYYCVAHPSSDRMIVGYADPNIFEHYDVVTGTKLTNQCDEFYAPHDILMEFSKWIIDSHCFVNPAPVLIEGESKNISK